MRKEYVYRCPAKCPINKKCFILKTAEPIQSPIRILQKCVAKKQDISLIIGDVKPP